MAAPHDWSSHIWTEQTLTRLIGSNQQQVEIRTSERMPQSFMVPQSLLLYYCPHIHPDLTLPGQPFIFDTTRPVLTLFFNWLYTGKVETGDWYNITWLYCLGHSARCIALMRSAISQLQEACRNGHTNDTNLFRYEHIAVIDEMVGPSPLSRYIGDTYFNHWRPEDDAGVDEDPSKHPKSNSFFKKLFERSFREQREGDNCSCCHDYCKYHGHESDAERLATCGGSSIPVVDSTNIVPVSMLKPEPTVRKAPKPKAPVHEVMSNELSSGIDSSLSYETRAATSRAGTPRAKAEETWLGVKSCAPVEFPAEYHGLLTSLLQVQSIKPSNWLEIGVEAEGVDQLPEPDRIIAAAMSWNAEDYAQTKCTFFNQYDATIINRRHWLNTLKFGGPKSKEKAERLLAMWESLGWLKASSTVATNREHTNPVVASTPVSHRVDSSMKLCRQISFGGKLVWSEEEKNAVAQIMKDMNNDESCANMGLLERARTCSERLESEYGYHRSERAVHHHWTRAQELTHPVAIVAETQQTQQFDDDTSDGEEDLTDVKAKRSSSWSSQEEQVMLEIMDALEKDPAYKDTVLKQRADVCKQRLKSRLGTERTSVAIIGRYRILRRKKETAKTDGSTNASANDSAIEGAMPNASQVNRPGSNAVVRRDRAEGAVSNVVNDTVIQRPERWTEQEDKALAEVIKGIEGDSSLSVLNERDQHKVCSARLLSKYEIERSASSIKSRWRRLSIKRKGNDVDGSDDDDDHDDHEPLMSRKKRKQGDSRFVAELFDAGED